MFDDASLNGTSSMADSDEGVHEVYRTKRKRCVSGSAHVIFSFGMIPGGILYVGITSRFLTTFVFHVYMIPFIGLSTISFIPIQILRILVVYRYVEFTPRCLRVISNFNAFRIMMTMRLRLPVQ